MNSKRVLSAMLVPIILLFILATALPGVNSGKNLDVLVQTSTHNYAAVVEAINELGGEVTMTFKYARGLAATIPASGLQFISALNEVEKILPDVIRMPFPISKQDARNTEDLNFAPGEASLLGDNYQIVTLNPVEIVDYLHTYWIYMAMGAQELWEKGIYGQGSLSVIIDTGVYADHAMLGRYPFGPVIGGVDLSSDVGTFYEGYDNPYNHWHGTHCAGILAGNGAQVIHESSAIYQAYVKYAGPLPSAEPYGYPPGYYILPLIGMAPFSQIYAIKVFDHTGGGTSESLIISAMEYAIDLHLSGTYDVDVINMSFGSGTGYDGRELEDQAVDYATSVGISVVTSAGNSGPASQTIASPGTANNAITVGAVSHPVNTRIFYEAKYGIGDYLMTANEPLIAYFSSRGPTSDGRDKPTVSATGVCVLSAYINPNSPGVSFTAWADGTSVACSAVAGTVALLNTWSEVYDLGASPYDYKEALQAGATWIEGFDKYDQGAGYINAGAAMAALKNDTKFGSVESIRYGYSRQSMMPKGTLIQGSTGTEITFKIKELSPGKAQHFYFELHPNAERITIELLELELGENPLGLNSFMVYIQSAARNVERYYVSARVYGDSKFVIEKMHTYWAGLNIVYNYLNSPLQPGYVRFVVESHWASYDNISAKMTIKLDHGDNSAKPDETYSGVLNTGESVGYFPVGFGPNYVGLELSWANDYKAYPVSNLDLYVMFIDDLIGWQWYVDSVTLNAPEVIMLTFPWGFREVNVCIVGQETYGIDEKWKLNVFYK